MAADKEATQEQAEPEAAAKVPPVLNQRVPNQYPLDLDDDKAGDEADDKASDDHKDDHSDDQAGQAASVERVQINHDSVHVYDLFKNPSCIATLVFFSALLSYYVVDSLPLGETYVAGFPYVLFAFAAAGCAGLVYVVNHLSGVPRLITLGLAGTAAVVGLMAAHPALLRINAMTDDGSMQVVEYVRMTQNHFDPVVGDWPAIDMIGRKYWLVVPGEVIRDIPIRRGGLGFYQADLTNIRYELELTEAFGGPD